MPGIRERMTWGFPARAACLGALWGGALSWLLASRDGFYGDFLAWWYGARVMLQGGNPYQALPVEYGIPEPLWYPLTALIAAVPVAPLPYLPAVVMFFAAGSGLFAYAAARQAPHVMPAFLGMPFLMAANLGHWSPWLAAAGLLPAMGWLVAVKPNIGLAVFAYRPSRMMVIGAALLALLSFVVSPRWVQSWFAGVQDAPAHTAPIGVWYGVPLLLAMLRWREPRARLLLVMAVMPQTMSFADQLVLALVASTRREAILMALTSMLAGIGWVVALQRSPDAQPVLLGLPFVVVGVYYPALVVVLRRPKVRSDEPRVA